MLAALRTDGRISSDDTHYTQAITTLSSHTDRSSYRIDAEARAVMMPIMQNIVLSPSSGLCHWTTKHWVTGSTKIRYSLSQGCGRTIAALEKVWNLQCSWFLTLVWRINLSPGLNWVLEGIEIWSQDACRGSWGRRVDSVIMSFSTAPAGGHLHGQNVIFQGQISKFC